jgi:tetratricopeptide (TPR) repeat protein
MRIRAVVVFVAVVSARAAAGPIVVSSVVCPTANAKACAAYDDGVRAGDRGDDAAAERLYRQAIALDPRFCDAMDNLGQIYRARGDDKRAMALYRRALAIEPHDTSAHISLAAAYSRAGNKTAALAEFDAIIAYAPDDPEGHFGKGNLLFGLSRFAEALPWLATAERLYAAAGSPLVVDTQMLEGIAYAGVGNWQKAHDMLAPIEAQKRDVKLVQEVLGRACLVLKDFPAAHEHLLRARALGAKIPDEMIPPAK